MNSSDKKQSGDRDLLNQETDECPASYVSDKREEVFEGRSCQATSSDEGDPWWV